MSLQAVLLLILGIVLVIIGIGVIAERLADAKNSGNKDKTR